MSFSGNLIYEPTNSFNLDFWGEKGDFLCVQLVKYTVGFKGKQYQKKLNAFKSLNAAMNPPASGENFNKLWQCNCILEFPIFLIQEIGISENLLLC